MKPWHIALLSAVMLVGCAARSHEARSRFVGDYYSPQPCSLGSDFELSLHADGSYRMIRILPEGVGPEMPDGGRAGFEEVGRWQFDGAAITLVPTSGEKLKLRPTVRDDVLVLEDTNMFGLRLEKQKPNKPLQSNAVDAPRNPGVVNAISRSLRRA